MNKKTLIIYFTYSGNTDTIAKYIQQKTSAKLCQIHPVEAYQEYRQTVSRALEELKSKKYPAIQPLECNLAEADLIFFGSPMWCGTFAPPLHTFLENNDLAGKKIAPFISHGGSGAANSVKDIQTLAPEATILKNLTFNKKDIEQLSDIVDPWLDEVGSLAE